MRGEDREPTSPHADLIDSLPGVVRQPGTRSDFSVEESAFERVVALLGEDLSTYKRALVEQALRSAVLRTRSADMPAYLVRLAEDSAEQENLRNTLLVSVTSFFREPAAFEAVKAKLFVPWLSEERAARPLRIWVPGCATGEEAYSLAISAFEAASEVGKPLQLQLFASDMDTRALQHARRGIYPRSIERELSPERLARFFVRQAQGYRVTRALRSCVSFVAHDVRRRPPFSRLDLISCRNLLLYFHTGVQQSVLRHMSSALRPRGGLLLAGSETIGAAMTHFEPLVATAKLYVRREEGKQPMKEAIRGLPPPTPDPRDTARQAEVLVLNQELLARARENQLLEGSLKTLLAELRKPLVLVDGSLRIRETSHLEHGGLPAASVGDGLAHYSVALGAAQLPSAVARCLHVGRSTHFFIEQGRLKGRMITVRPIASSDGTCYPGAWLEFDGGGSGR